MRAWIKHAISLLGRKRFLPLFLIVLFLPAVVLAATETEIPDGVESFLLVIGGLMLHVVNAIGKLVATLMELVIVPIMQYDGFGTSKVISAGWGVVRDIMNMGFIVALLIIAMVTIFGGQVGSWSVKWQQQIPRLLLFAILINFSRLICSLLIDIGQVFMLTFANAVKDIAGGNIIQLFGLPDIVSFDSEKIADLLKKDPDGQGVDPFGLFASAFLALLMMLIVLGTMIILTIVLIYRIVMLWILVVLSPLAFFFGGAKGLFGSKVKPYEDWWAKFTGSVAIGPVLIFFLWLTLSVAGSGSIAASEEFPVGTSVRTDFDATSPSGNQFLIRIGEPGRLLSFIIGIGMMYAGFEAATSFSGALPGAASKLVSGGVRGALGIGAGATAGAALLAGRGALKAGAVGARGAAAVGAAGVGFLAKTSGGQFVQKGVAGVARGVGGYLQGTGAVGAIIGLRALGRKATRTGTELEENRRTALAERVKKEGQDIKEYTKDEMDANLKSKAMTPDGVARQQAMRYRVLTDEKLRKEYDQVDLQKMVGEFEKAGGEEMLHGDHDMEKTYKDAMKKRPDLVGDPAKREKVIGELDETEIMGLDADAYKDASVQSRLKEMKWFDRGANKEITMYERIKNGRGGVKKSLQKALEEGESGKTLDAKKISDEGARNLSESKQTEANLAELAKQDAGEGRPLGKLTNLVESANFQIQRLDVGLLSDPKAAAALAAAVPAALSRLADHPEKSQAFQSGLAQALSDQAVGGKAKAQAREAMLMSAPDSSKLHESFGYNKEANTMSAEGAAALKSALKTRPEIAIKFGGDIMVKNALGNAIAANADMGQLHRAYTSADAAQKDDYANVFEQLGELFTSRVAELEKSFEDRTREAGSAIQNQLAGVGLSDAERNAVDSMHAVEKELKAVQRNLDNFRRLNPNNT